MIPEPKRLYRLRLYHVEDVLKLHAGPCPSFSDRLRRDSSKRLDAIYCRHTSIVTFNLVMLSYVVPSGPTTIETSINGSLAIDRRQRTSKNTQQQKIVLYWKAIIVFKFSVSFGKNCWPFRFVACQNRPTSPLTERNGNFGRFSSI